MRRVAFLVAFDVPYELDEDTLRTNLETIVGNHQADMGYFHFQVLEPDEEE